MSTMKKSDFVYVGSFTNLDEIIKNNFFWISFVDYTKSEEGEPFALCYTLKQGVVAQRLHPNDEECDELAEIKWLGEFINFEDPESME